MTTLQDNIKRYDSLFTEDDMLNDAVNKYVNGQITKDDLLFYLEWNDFDESDVDWNEIEKARKKGANHD